MPADRDSIARTAPPAPPGPTTEAPPTAPPTRRSRGRTYGAELDGTILRVVEVVDDVAVSFTVYRGDTVARAVRQFLAAKSKGPVVVAWHSGSTQVAPLEFAQVPEPALLAAVMDAADAQMPNRVDSAIAARILGIRDGRIQAIAAQADTEALEEVWEAFRGSPTVVVPAPLVFTNDGLFLGIRNESVDLTLVERNAVVAHRHLSCGGLAAVYRELGPELDRAFERLSNVVRGAGQQDLEAVQILQRYVVELGAQITRTTDFWTRQTLTIPSDIAAHGPGFLLPNLAGTLMDAALFLKPVELPNIVDAIARVERPVSFVALMAGLADLDEQPCLELPDPHLAEAARRQRTRDRSRKRVVVGAGSALGLALAGFGVLQLAGRQVTAAEERLETAKAELASFRPAQVMQDRARIGTTAFQSALEGDVAWSSLIDNALTALPAGSRPEQLLLERNEDRVNLSVVVDVPGRQDAVTPLLDALTRMGARQPWVPNLAAPTKDPKGNESIKLAVTTDVAVKGRYDAPRAAETAATPAAAAPTPAAPANPNGAGT